MRRMISVYSLNMPLTQLPNFFRLAQNNYILVYPFSCILTFLYLVRRYFMSCSTASIIMIFLRSS